MNYYIAVDLGASSGRHIVGFEENGQFKLEELYRFPNGMKSLDGHLIWDIDEIFNHVVKGIKCCFEKYGCPKSISIDTWGVDYVLLKGDQTIYPVYAYRDNRTEKSISLVHEIISFDKLYAKTGTQFQTFNTIYQLYCDKIDGRLDGVTDFLMIPEYLSYRLTGVKLKDFTEASTTGLINVSTRQYDLDIINSLGFNKELFKEVYQPPKLFGNLKKEYVDYFGGDTEVVMCASHDTASAFEAIDCDDKSIILSSGTWSLIGTKIKNASTDKLSYSSNFANEGGLGYFRYLKNIMGMWIINQLQKEKGYSITQIVEMAEKSKFTAMFDVNDQSLVAPVCMSEAIISLLRKTQKFNDLTDGDLFNSVYLSLANSYKKAVDQIEFNLNKKFDKIYIVGGGAKNKYLNSLTEKATNKKIIALPIEATAIGNIKVQSRRLK